MRNCTFMDIRTSSREKKIFEIIERLYNDGSTALLFTSSEERANELDSFLWTFRQESFIPHRIFLYDEENPLEKVAIVFREFNPLETKNLIADAPCSLKFALKFDQVYDFVDHSTKEKLEASRERYKIYKGKDFNLHYEKE